MNDNVRKMVFRCTMSLRWGDMDAYGHLNNTVYFRLCEQARVEWIESLGFPVGPMASDGPVIVNAACTFMRPINYPATIVIDVLAGVPGRSSVMTWYDIRVDGEEGLCAEGSSKIVWIDTASGRSVPIPDALRAVLPV